MSAAAAMRAVVTTTLATCHIGSDMYFVGTAGSM